MATRRVLSDLSDLPLSGLPRWCVADRKVHCLRWCVLHDGKLLLAVGTGNDDPPSGEDASKDGSKEFNGEARVYQVIVDELDDRVEVELFQPLPCVQPVLALDWSPPLGQMGHEGQKGEERILIVGRQCGEIEVHKLSCTLPPLTLPPEDTPKATRYRPDPPFCWLAASACFHA